jgi:syntaxin-binding protein 1
MEAFNRGGLEKVCEAEQAAATGGNTDNKKVEVDQICKLVNACLEDPDIEHEDKVRLVMLLNAAVDHGDAKVRKTVQNARLSAGEEEALKHLISVKNVSGRKKQQRTPGKDEWEFDLSRYFPCVKDLYNHMVAGKLDVKEYPFISKDDEDKFGSASASSLTPAQSKRKDGGSTPAAASKWAQAGKSPSTPAKGKKSGGSINKFIIFVAGGISYTEIREAYTKSASDNIQCYIGSTEIFRPSQFVELISKLGQPAADDEAPSSAPKRGGKSPRILDSDDESDERPAKRAAKPSATPAKKASTATSAKKAGSAAKKRQDSSEEDSDEADENSDESSEERPAKRVTAAKKAGSTSTSTVKKAQPVAAKKTQPVAAKKATPAKKATRRRDDTDSDS